MSLTSRNSLIQAYKNQGGGEEGYYSPFNFGEDTPMLPEYQKISSLNASGVYTPQTLAKSPWLGMASGMQAQGQNEALANLGTNQQTAFQQGSNALAMKGGLSAGASQRLADRGMENLATARQNTLGQGVSDSATIGMQKAQMDTDLSKFNAGNLQNANQFNVANSLQDLAGQNEQNRKRYGSEMTLLGANKSGAAIDANTGKK